MKQLVMTAALVAVLAPAALADSLIIELPYTGSKHLRNVQLGSLETCSAKTAAAGLFGVDAGDYNLVFKGRVMKAGQTLAEAGVPNHGRLFLREDTGSSQC